MLSAKVNKTKYITLLLARSTLKRKYNSNIKYKHDSTVTENLKNKVIVTGNLLLKNISMISAKLDSCWSYLAPIRPCKN